LLFKADNLSDASSDSDDEIVSKKNNLLRNKINDNDSDYENINVKNLIQINDSQRLSDDCFTKDDGFHKKLESGKATGQSPLSHKENDSIKNPTSIDERAITQTSQSKDGSAAADKRESQKSKESYHHHTKSRMKRDLSDFSYSENLNASKKN
jgi:hypothetical protein